MSKTIHVVSILDRSGSMVGTENEVIGAYNSFIDEQKELAKKEGLKIKASLILFDNMYEEVYKKVPINDVEELDSTVYSVRGMTALFDAIGKTIASFDDKKNVIMFIETDGHENASKEYTNQTLKDLVKSKEDAGWEFNFVGADLDVATVKDMGAQVGIGKTMAFDKSFAGYSSRNALFSAATAEYSKKVSTK